MQHLQHEAVAAKRDDDVGLLGVDGLVEGAELRLGRGGLRRPRSR